MTKKDLLDENMRLRKMYFHCSQDRSRYYMVIRDLVDFLETLDDEKASELLKQVDSIIYEIK